MNDESRDEGAIYWQASLPGTNLGRLTRQRQLRRPQSGAWPGPDLSPRLILIGKRRSGHPGLRLSRLWLVSDEPRRSRAGGGAEPATLRGSVRS